ncbi:MAG: PstS family phosphate ABC transporter substrate-binding protein [Oscillatoriales cyanobacterium SM2_1_8]|nr:PstS family phosphate ABC transporter substrate-binding protein [Oscillatoriales cyanobacterium SM2_1_8]
MAAVLGLATGGAAMAQAQTVRVTGSSTVFPISQAIAKGVGGATVEFTGTTGGFQKFCQKQFDVAGASRPIRPEELAACRRAGVFFYELPIAMDALTVVANPQNTWVTSLSVAELRKMWEPAAEKKITNWRQVRSSFPDRPLVLLGAGQDSGTYDYFTEAIVGQPRSSRTDYIGSEDDEELVAGVRKNVNALAFFGLSYYEQHRAHLKAVAIEGPKGAVLPSAAAVLEGRYQPLARPLFIYVNQASMQRPEVRTFVNAYLTKAPQVVAQVGYVPLSPQAYRVVQNRLDLGRVGTVFGGKSPIGMTLRQLLTSQGLQN